jgi:hypothetical protein
VLHPLAHRAQPQYRVEVDPSSKYATDEVSLWDSTKMAVKDPKTWLLCSILQCNFIAVSVTIFFPIVASGLGFSRTVTLAIAAPPYILCCIAITINGWHSDKTGAHPPHHLPLDQHYCRQRHCHFHLRLPRA